MGSPGISTVPYPGLPPTQPPVDYPYLDGRLPRWLWPAVALVVLLAMALLLALTVNTTGSISTRPSDPAIRTAIQQHLDALNSDDTKTLARDAGCGLFDKVRDQKSDLAMSGLIAEAFKKDFGKVTVKSIDKVVPLSEFQLNVLLTVQVETMKGELPQAQAQLLKHDGQLYVCSYFLRGASGVS